MWAWSVTVNSRLSRTGQAHSLAASGGPRPPHPCRHHRHHGTAHSGSGTNLRHQRQQDSVLSTTRTRQQGMGVSCDRHDTKGGAQLVVRPVARADRRATVSPSGVHTYATAHAGRSQSRRGLTPGVRTARLAWMGPCRRDRMARPWRRSWRFRTGPVAHASPSGRITHVEHVETRTSTSRRAGHEVVSDRWWGRWAGCSRHRR